MRAALPTLVAGSLALAACAHSPATTMLTLDAVPPAAVAAAYRGPPIAVPAVQVPAVLDRAAFVRQIGAGQVKVDDFAQWAAPLGTLARDTLVRDLVARLPEGKVLPPGATGGGQARVLSVTILSYDAAAGGAHLQLAYRFLPDGAVAEARFQTDGDASTPVASAQAFSRLLGQFADRIAAGLK